MRRAGANQWSRQKAKVILTLAAALLLLPLLPQLLPLLLPPPPRWPRLTLRPCGRAGTASLLRRRWSRRETCPGAGGAASGEGGWWRWRRVPGGCRWIGCGRDRHGGGGARKGRQSGEGGWWMKRKRSGGDGGRGGGGGGRGDGDGVGEAGRQRTAEQRCDWLAGGADPPAGAPCLGEVGGRRMWWRRSDGGRAGGGGGGRSGGSGGATASQRLSGETGRGRCSRLLPA